MHFARQMHFKMLKIIFFLEKKTIKKCVSTLPKISDPLPETHLFFFIWPY